MSSSPSNSPSHWSKATIPAHGALIKVRTFFYLSIIFFSKEEINNKVKANFDPYVIRSLP